MPNRTESTAFDRLQQTMINVAWEAGKFLVGFRPQAKRMATKKDFLLNADLESDRLIRDALFAAYPTIPYTSEEQEINSTLSQRFAVDPIDASYNYGSGDSNWAVSIAYLENDETKVGVVFLPALGELYSATSDTSAIRQHLDGFTRRTSERLKVNDHTDLKSGQIWIEWGKEMREGLDHERVYELIPRLDRHSLYPQIRNCAAGDPIAVARGIATGFVMINPDPFDCAAAGLIVAKAGGIVTDLDGNPWRPSSKSIVATNGIISVHDELLKVLEGI
jgi:myo-inositol-1(or 4)-monophosphatase